MALVLPISLAVLLIVLPWSASFGIKAQTESARITVKPSGIRWYLADAVAETPEGQVLPIRGLIDVNSAEVIELVRRGHGETWITLLGGRDIRRFDDAGEPLPPLPAGSLLRLPGPGPTTPIVLPISGEITIGDEVRAMVDPFLPTLLEGEVRVLGKSIFGQDLYEAGLRVLGAGDRAHVVTDNAQPSEGYGLVRIAEQAGFSIVAHATGDFVQVDRFGSDGYTIRPSLWSRIARDPVVETIALVMLAVAPFMFSLARWLMVARSGKQDDEVSCRRHYAFGPGRPSGCRAGLRESQRKRPRYPARTRR